jgi:serine/threonine-protein kinase
MQPCTRCGNPFDVRRYCPVCGAEQDPQPRGPDSLVGAVIGERYQIVERVAVGGMGAVYRALQRPLGRTVALKFIHPHLLTTPGVADRFLNEAQAASRLNHPNVVSIFDFGHSVRDGDNQLYLVMEFLTGPDLMSALAANESMPLARVADIFRQILAGLGEAHHHGITHRDVKPDNVIIERKRSGGDQVKVIDFGIAKLPGAGRALTQAGHVVGTPQYLAPEQLRGQVAGPLADLYAVGVMLYQTLTGAFPFEGTPAQILAQQTSGRPPDPRHAAPARNIPEELAKVTMRALDPEPAARYADAETLAEAIQRAATHRSWTRIDASLFPPRAPASGQQLERTSGARGAVDSSSADREESDRLGRSTTMPAPHTPSATATEPRLSIPSPRPISRPFAFVGRAAEMAWVRALTSEGGGKPVLLWGRAGSGRTRLLQEIGVAAGKAGVQVESFEAPPVPRNEVGFGTLRAMIADLVGTKPDDPLLREGAGAEGAPGVGLRMVYGEPGAVPDALGDDGRLGAAGAALRWAFSRAARRAAGRRVLVCIDDADRLDGSSARALSEALCGEWPAGLALVATLGAPPDRLRWPAAHERELRGLSAADAATLLRASGRSGAPPGADDVEPLLIEQLARGPRGAAESQKSGDLRELVEWRLRNLLPAEVRVLQAVAVAGAAAPVALASILVRPEDIDDALVPLMESGFVEMRDGRVRATHALYGTVALETAPLGAITELHARAAEELGGRSELVELRAFHALRGAPDFAAFLLVETAARLRQMRGDHAGTVAALRDAVSAARVEMLRSSEEAESALLLFGHKLGAALVDAGELDEARQVLEEALDVAHPTEKGRALVLEQLMRLARVEGRSAEADQYRRAAVGIAQAAGDRLLVERLGGLSAASRVRVGQRREDEDGGGGARRARGLGN